MGLEEQLTETSQPRHAEGHVASLTEIIKERRTVTGERKVP